MADLCRLCDYCFVNNFKLSYFKPKTFIQFPIQRNYQVNLGFTEKGSNFRLFAKNSTRAQRSCPEEPIIRSGSAELPILLIVQIDGNLTLMFKIKLK